MMACTVFCGVGVFGAIEPMLGSADCCRHSTVAGVAVLLLCLLFLAAATALCPMEALLADHTCHCWPVRYSGI